MICIIPIEFYNPKFQKCGVSKYKVEKIALSLNIWNENVLTVITRTLVNVT